MNQNSVMKSRKATVLGAMALMCLVANAARASETVTVDNFVRAETDTTMGRYVAQGAFGRFLHVRGMTPIDKQDVIRMNRDTLYSFGVFDLTTPVTIVKPDPGKRFQSMMMISEDHSILPVEHGAGEFTLTRQQVGTRYVMVLSAPSPTRTILPTCRRRTCCRTASRSGKLTQASSRCRTGNRHPLERFVTHSTSWHQPRRT